MSQTYTLNGTTYYCTKCGTEVRPGKGFCSGCGEPLPLQAQQTFAPQSPTQTSQFSPNPKLHFPLAPKAPSMPQNTSGTASQPAQAEPKPIRVIAMQKKFVLVACLKDLILPGNGFIYTERMTEGAIIGLLTIPLTVWGVLNYLHLWFTDLLSNFRNMGGSAAPDYTTSDNFKIWLIGLSVGWLIVRSILLYQFVEEHNKKITKLADVSQLVTFVDGK